jgi:hypothetical protein
MDLMRREENEGDFFEAKVNAFFPSAPAAPISSALSLRKAAFREELAYPIFVGAIAACERDGGNSDRIHSSMAYCWSRRRTRNVDGSIRRNSLARNASALPHCK